MKLNEQLLLVSTIVQLIVGIGLSYYGYTTLVRSGYGKLYSPIVAIILGWLLIFNTDISK